MSGLSPMVSRSRRVVHRRGRGELGVLPVCTGRVGRMGAIPICTDGVETFIQGLGVGLLFDYIFNSKVIIFLLILEFLNLTHLDD